MRLLFDQNLSPHLIRRLATVFPDSLHVRDLGLTDATDRQVWERALLDDLTIVTKDADYQGFAGPPPRFIWVRLGNCTTDDVERLLREHRSEIVDFSHRSNAMLRLG